jgi:site-specific DNA-cytosine methylase
VRAASGGFHQALNNINAECVFACDIDENVEVLKKLGITPEEILLK